MNQVPVTPDKDLASPPSVGPNPTPRGTMDVLRRWRVPIGATLVLAMFEVVYYRVGLWEAVVAVGLLCIGPIFFYGVVHLARSVPLAIASTFVLVVGTVALSRFVELPWAIGTALVSALAVASQVWKLKLRHLMILLVVVAAAIRFGMAFGMSALVVAGALAPPL